MFAGYRHCKKCGKALMGLFDGALCEECEKEENSRMTNEEAIANINMIRVAFVDPVTKEQRKLIDDTLDMAIKALEQEPTTTTNNNEPITVIYPTIVCEDVISREAVKKWVCKTCPDDAECQRDCDVIKGIDALPPATPQQKYGKWIKHPEIETSAPKYLMFYECSECGDKQCFCKPDIHKKRFCSNCGARMIEPQESEEV